MKNYKKYIIALSFSDEYDKKLRILMDNVSLITNTPPLYNHMIPHVTLHRPLSGINYEKIINLAQSIALRLHKSRIRVGGIEHFGKKYIVLPVHATYTIASLWSGIHELLSQVPEYEHGPFDHDNTLHITLAKDTEEIFDQSWNTLREKCFTESFDIPVDRVSVYGKLSSGDWGVVQHISLPENK